MSSIRTKKLSILLLIFASAIEVKCNTSRQKYGGRVLNITPRDCKSPKFPNLTGTCMISLECGQIAGRVIIGACRHGMLFGACCYEPDAIDEGDTVVTVSARSDLESEISSNSTSKYTDDKKLTQTNIRQTSSDKDVDATFTNQTINQTNAAPQKKSTKLNDANIITVLFKSTYPSMTNLYEKLTSKSIEQITEPTTLAQDKFSEVSHSTTTEENPSPTTMQSILDIKISVKDNILNTESTTVASELTSTKKFVYGKIKFTPRPFKARSTGSGTKTIWTRPPTTESSYVVFKASEEEDEDEDEGERYSKIPSSIATESSIGSLETTTPQRSETTTVTSITTSTTSKPSNSPVNTTSRTTSNIKIETPTSSTDNESEIPLTSNISNRPVLQNIKENFNRTLFSNKSSLVKQSRITNENELDNHGEDDNHSLSSSSGWDNKLDDFVNQVVEGIAQELDKSNIDEVVFKSTSTTPRPTTTVSKKSTTKKPELKKKHKNTKPSKGSNHRNSSKGHSLSKSSQRKKKPLKKVTILNKYSNETDIVLLDYRKSCGVRTLDTRQSRIVGGSPSNYGSWPWFVLVKETTWWGVFSKIKCGGVLISSRHVLTAAHCQPQKTGTLSVVLGVTDSDNPNSNSVTKGVRRIVKHPQFNPRSYENDIAILELDSPVEFQPHIVPICLPNLKQTFEGKEGFVTGMGLLKHDGERPLVLHEVDVPIINNTECQSMFRRSGNSKPIKPSFICAGYPQGLKDSCGGDSGSYRNKYTSQNETNIDTNMNETTDFFSGGPLSVQMDKNSQQWVLAGTVSHGIKCAVPNQPGVYMRTTWYKPWIEKVTKATRERESSKCYGGPPGSCDRGRSGGFFNTLFRVFRLARKIWKSRK